MYRDIDPATLFSPVAIGPLSLANRVVVAPMTRTSATPEGHVTPRMVDYYADFGRGGFSAVITEGAYLDEGASQGYRGQPGIANVAQVDAWKTVVDAVHAAGAAIVLQLMHAGPLSQYASSGEEPVGPSAVQPAGTQLTIQGGDGPFRLPREMTSAQIAEVPATFAAAAARAQAAGFDGVEVHGANGYLLDAFLSTTTNQRTDEYGGSVANRIRLTAEVIRAVRATVGPDFVVGVRISQSKVNDFDYTWSGGHTDAEVIFPALVEAGASYLHVTEHDISKEVFESGSTLAALARILGGVPTIANGGLGDPATASVVISGGDADLISLGKPALANPDWPLRVRANGPLDQFDFEMLLPLAKLEFADAWRERQNASRQGSVIQPGSTVELSGFRSAGEEE